MRTIHELRKAGHKIKIQHFRHQELRHFPIGKIVNSKLSILVEEREIRKQREGYTMSGRGGKTTLTLQLPNNGLTVTASATCSLADNFSHKFGTQLALERAFNKIKDD